VSIALSSLPANSSDPRRRLADNVGNQSISKYHYDYYYYYDYYYHYHYHYYTRLAVSFPRKLG